MTVVLYVCIVAARTLGEQIECISLKCGALPVPHQALLSIIVACGLGEQIDCISLHLGASSVGSSLDLCMFASLWRVSSESEVIVFPAIWALPVSEQSLFCVSWRRWDGAGAFVVGDQSDCISPVFGRLQPLIKP